MRSDIPPDEDSDTTDESGAPKRSYLLRPDYLRLNIVELVNRHRCAGLGAH